MTENLFIENHETGTYSVVRDPTADEIITQAEQLLSCQVQRGEPLQSPQAVKRYLRLTLTSADQEVFGCLFLDNRHRIISFEKLFFGTIDSAAVYPRVVAKKALDHRAAAVILAHNHPSGEASVSSADRAITKRLVDALDLLDIRVLDHVIVGAEQTTSFAERGWL